MIKISEILNNDEIKLLENYHSVPKYFNSFDEFSDYADEIIEIGVDLLNGNEPDGPQIDDIANKLATFE